MGWKQSDQVDKVFIKRYRSCRLQIITKVRNETSTAFIRWRRDEPQASCPGLVLFNLYTSPTVCSSVISIFTLMTVTYIMSYDCYVLICKIKDKTLVQIVFFCYMINNVVCQLKWNETQKNRPLPILTLTYKTCSIVVNWKLTLGKCDVFNLTHPTY